MFDKHEDKNTIEKMINVIRNENLINNQILTNTIEESLPNSLSLIHEDKEMKSDTIIESMHSYNTVQMKNTNTVNDEYVVYETNKIKIYETDNKSEVDLIFENETLMKKLNNKIGDEKSNEKEEEEKEEEEEEEKEEEEEEEEKEEEEEEEKEEEEEEEKEKEEEEEKKKEEKEEEKEKTQPINQKSLCLKDLRQDVEFLNQKYRSIIENNKKNENEISPFKEIYEELTNSKHNEKKNLELVSSVYNSYNDLGTNNETDDMFLQKIEYLSDTDNENHSKTIFGMSGSALDIWNSINKLEKEKEESDLKSIESFSKLVKKDFDSDENEENYMRDVDSFTSSNLEKQKMKTLKPNLWSVITESEKSNLYENFSNSDYSKKEYDEKKEDSIISIREKNNIDDTKNCLGNEQELIQFEKKKDFQNINNLETKEEKCFLPEKTCTIKETINESIPFATKYKHIFSTDEEEKEEDEGTSTVADKKVVGKESEWKKKETEGTNNKDRNFNLKNLQNWISLRKNSMLHFAAEKREHTHKETLKIWKALEAEKEKEAEVKKKVMRKKEKEKDTDTDTKMEREKEREMEMEREMEREMEEKGKEKKQDVHNENGIMIKEIKRKVETNDVEICVNFNDDEQWEEQEKEVKTTDHKIGTMSTKKEKKKKSVTKKLKEKIDISNTNNEKTKIEKIKLPTKKNSFNEKGKGKTKKTQENEKKKLIEENDEWNILGKELNKQIAKLEKEQEKVKKLEYELIAKSAEIELEREDMKNQIEKEKEQMKKTIEEEKKKWAKEKKRIEGEVEKQRNIILSRKKLTNEIALYKNKITQLEKIIENDKKQHKIAIEKLKKQVEHLTKENEKMKMELKISEEYRNKLENYQQKTILKLAKNSNEQNIKSKSYTSLSECKEKNNYTSGNICEKRNKTVSEGNAKKEKKTKIEKEKEITHLEERNSLSESETSSSKEMKKILHEKGNIQFNEMDIIYDSLNNRYETLKNIQTNKKKNNDIFDNNNTNTKITNLNNLFVRESTNKKEENNIESQINEEEIDKNIKKIKSMINKNKKLMNSEQTSSTVGINDSSNETYTESKENCENELINIFPNDPIYSKQFFFEKKEKNIDSKNNSANQTVNQYKGHVIEEKKTPGEENLKNLHPFNSDYPYNKIYIMNNEKKKANNYETLFENLNEKICIDNLSDHLSRSSLREHENEHFNKDYYQQNYVDENIPNVVAERATEFSKKYIESNVDKLSDKLNSFENSSNINVTNSINKNNKGNYRNGLNPFGKDWTFLLNFNFDELFEKCENILKSTFSLSKKIKYRQAFVDGKVETLFEDGLKILEKNKNKKIVHPDNIIIHLFYNKDYKAQLPNSYMLYHFASKGIYQVNIPNMCQLNKFPSGQIECKYNDGHMQILFADGKRKEILQNKEEYTFLMNGTAKKIN